MSTPHIAAEKGEIAERILLPGDPLRAKFIAEHFLDDAKEYTHVRNILGYTGTYKGVPVSVQGTGMGIPSISIYVHELIHTYGCKKLIRVGTCGGISRKVAVKDVVVASAAHTNSSVATIDVPGVSLSLTASFDMLRGAVDAARASGKRVHVGPVYTSDFFYSSRMDIVPALDKLGTLGVEMEAAGLFACALAAGKEAAAVLTVSDHLFDGSGDLTSEERESLFQDALEAAIGALKA